MGLSAAQTRLAPVDDAPQPRPFLKWAGGKGQLLEQFKPLLPRLKGRYFEPFVGGAALFFSLRPENAVLSDVNEELIDCYRAVRDDVEGVIAALGEHRYARDHFYAVRSIDPATLPLAKRAARTIYLNKTGFNGLYRVNKSGRFNVPIGRYLNPVICDAANLRACSRALSGVELEVQDFGKVVSAAKADDFVYFDPPYVPLSDTAHFTSYVAGGFGLKEQSRLAAVFAELAAKGVYVMLSNSDTPIVRDLYKRFRIDVVLASRNINSNSARRGKVGEVVVRSFVKGAKSRLRRDAAARHPQATLSDHRDVGASRPRAAGEGQAVSDGRDKGKGPSRGKTKPEPNPAREPRGTVRHWLRANGYPDVADLIDQLMARWRRKGLATRRNWWDILSGGENGAPRVVGGVEFPVIAAAQRRQGRPVTNNALRRGEESETVVRARTRWSHEG